MLLGVINAPYMEWAKHRPRVAYDLAASGIRAVTTAELLGPDARASDLFSLSGPNDDGYVPLVEAIARAQDTTSDRVACAAGTSGANFLSMLALISRGDEVLIESPVYDPLLAVAELAGARIRRVTREFGEGYGLDPDRVASLLTDRTRLLVIANPHNPTGAVLDRDRLLAIGRAAERVGASVLVDEVYRAAVLPGTTAPVSAASLDGPFIVTNSLTKAWGLAGLRVGWVIADPPLAERVRRMRDLVDVIGAFPAEQLAVRAFEQLPSLGARTACILAEQWPLAQQALDRCPGLAYVPPRAGMMVFPRFNDGRDADGMVERLCRERDTLVVPGRFFEAPPHFRLSFGGAREAVERGLEHLVAVASSL